MESREREEGKGRIGHVEGKEMQSAKGNKNKKRDTWASKHYIYLFYRWLRQDNNRNSIGAW